MAISIRSLRRSSPEGDGDSHSGETEVVDIDAYEELFREYVPRLAGYVRRHVHDYELIDDIIQETLLRAYRHGIHLESDGEEWRWISTVARNLCIDYRALHRNWREHHNDPTVGAPTIDLTDGAPDPETQAIATESWGVVAEALDGLSARERRLLLNKHVDGQGVLELAAREGMHVEAVKSALRRARRAFRDSYAAATERARAIVVLGPALVGLKTRLRGGKVRVNDTAERFVAAAVQTVQSTETVKAAGAAMLAGLLMLVPGLPGVLGPESDGDAPGSTAPSTLLDGSGPAGAELAASHQSGADAGSPFGAGDAGTSGRPGGSETFDSGGGSSPGDGGSPPGDPPSDGPGVDPPGGFEPPGGDDISEPEPEPVDLGPESVEEPEDAYIKDIAYASGSQASGESSGSSSSNDDTSNDRTGDDGSGDDGSGDDGAGDDGTGDDGDADSGSDASGTESDETTANDDAADDESVSSSEEPPEDGDDASTSGSQTSEPSEDASESSEQADSENDGTAGDSSTSDEENTEAAESDTSADDESADDDSAEENGADGDSTGDDGADSTDGGTEEETSEHDASKGDEGTEGNGESSTGESSASERSDESSSEGSSDGIHGDDHEAREDGSERASDDGETSDAEDASGTVVPTVFALGEPQGTANDGCHAEAQCSPETPIEPTPCAVQCSVLFHSVDGGATWEKLPAKGLDAEQLLLPPTYPDDPRIFAVGKFGLMVSDDAGHTFTLARPLGPDVIPQGYARVSGAFWPGFGRDGEDRIVVAHSWSGAWVFHATTGVVEPLMPGTLMVQGIRPVQDRDGTGALLVLAAEQTADGQPIREAVDGSAYFSLRAFSRGARDVVYTVYRCAGTGCEPRFILPHSAHTQFVGGTQSSDGPVLVVQNEPGAMYRSDDAGRSFAEVNLEGALPPRLGHTDFVVDGGRVYTAMRDSEHVGGAERRRWETVLYASDDRGQSWNEVARSSDATTLVRLTVLPSGRIIATGFLADRSSNGHVHNRPTVMCSDDEGQTWASRCSMAPGE